MGLRDLLYIALSMPVISMVSGTAMADTNGLRARQDLPLGHVLRVEDIIGANGQDFVGARTTRAIPHGTHITPKMVAHDEVITRNQKTTAFFIRGGVRLIIQARALNSGRAGDRIELVNLNSRKKITGIVQNDGTIHVY